MRTIPMTFLMVLGMGYTAIALAADQTQTQVAATEMAMTGEPYAYQKAGIDIAEEFSQNSQFLEFDNVAELFLTFATMNTCESFGGVMKNPTDTRGVGKGFTILKTKPSPDTACGQEVKAEDMAIMVYGLKLGEKFSVNGFVFESDPATKKILLVGRISEPTADVIGQTNTTQTGE